MLHIPVFQLQGASVFERMTAMKNERTIIIYAQISFWIFNPIQYQVRALRGHG
jgi:hypothetical protein